MGERAHAPIVVAGTPVGLRAPSGATAVAPAAAGSVPSALSAPRQAGINMVTSGWAALAAAIVTATALRVSASSGRRGLGSL